MNKYIKLAICILVDVMGYLSFTLPVIGEVSDVFWAPISAIILYALFQKKVGATGAIVNLVEELTPGLDVIPTLTITWCYVYLKKNKK